MAVIADASQGGRDDLQCGASANRAEARNEIEGMMTWDAAKGKHVALWFDSYGASVGIYYGTFTDSNTMVFKGESDFQGHKYNERLTWKKLDDGGIHFAIEVSMDGENCAQMMESTYTN